MEAISNEYAYRFEDAMVAFVPEPIMIASITAFVVICALSLAIGPYLYGYIVYRKKESEKIEKRRMIQDLIIMKEVQNELDEEMRSTLTNIGATS